MFKKLHDIAVENLGSPFYGLEFKLHKDDQVWICLRGVRFDGSIVTAARSFDFLAEVLCRRDLAQECVREMALEMARSIEEAAK